jgi:plasmid stabilization system protein ParE
MPLTREIIWRKSALQYLEKAIDYIRTDSEKNAAMVANAILANIEKAARFPKHFPRDKYRLNNNTGLFRAFEIYSFRVSFYCNAETIRIVRIRHTKQKPLNY